MDLSGLGKFATDVVKGVGAPLIAAWDLATAPWNDKEEFNGFWNTVKTTGGRFASNVYAPFGTVASAAAPAVMPVLNKIDQINNELIRRPLTTFQLVSTGPLNEKLDPEAWKRAYAATEDPTKGVTFSQALTGGVVAPLAGKKNFDIYDEGQRDEVFRKNLFGKTLTGTIDAGVLIFGDVTIGAGKAAKAVRESSLVTGKIKTADDAMTAAQAIRRAAGGETNKWTRVLDDFANNDSIYAYNHPMVKSASAQGPLAHALGAAKTPQEAADVLAAGLGDPAALEALKARRFDLGMELQRAQGEMDAFQKSKVYGSIDPTTGTASLFPWEDADVALEASKELGALRQNYDYLDNLVNLAKTSQTGNITRTTGDIGAVQSFDNFLANRRSRAFFESESRFKPIVDSFQTTPFGKMVHVIRYPFHERPAGLVNLNDDQSSREIIAAVTQGLGLANGARPGKFAKGVEATGDAFKFVDEDGVMHTYGAVTDARARAMVDSYLSATTPEQRSKTVLDIEQAIFTSLAGKHGITKEAAEAFYNKYTRARVSALQSMKQHGFATDLDGSPVLHPLFESQTANYLPMMDFALVDRLLGRKDMPNIMRELAKGGESILHYADVFNDAFKLGALLRFGYTVRNGVEAQLRIAAATGSMGSLQYLGSGMKNLFANAGERGSRVIDRIVGKAGPKQYQEMKTSFARTQVELRAVQKRIKELDAEIAKNPVPAAIAERNILMTRADDHQNVLQTISSSMAKMEERKVKGIGQGSIDVASKYTTSDGQNVYVVGDAFGGPLGDMWQRSVSVEGSLNRFVNDNAHLVGKDMASSGFGTVMPEQPHFWTEWANTLNTVMRNSQIIRMFAGGKTPAQVKHFLLTDLKGRELRKRLDLSVDGLDEYLTVANKFVDDHMPNAEIRAMLLSNEKITPEMLRSVAPDVANLKPINGNMIEDNLLRISDSKIKNVVTQAFRLLGSVPEDRLARNPLYVSSYRDAIRRRVGMFEELNKRPLTADELWDAQKAAHDDALKFVKSTLFNIDRKTNAAYALRMIAPFFSAYENAIKSWSKMAYDRPELLMRGYYAFTAPNRMGIATDQYGNPVPVDKASMDDVIWVSMPEWMKKSIGKLPVVGGAESLSEIGITKRSLDVLFQGDFNVPFGPYVAIPISYIVKDRPDLEETMKWAVPFGVTDPISMLPTWLRRQIQKSQGEDNATYNRFFNLIYNTEMQNWRERGGDIPGNERPTMKEIKNRTNAYYNLHSFANLILPFAPRFNSPYRFYIDKYHEYQQAFGQDAAEKFFDQYGEQYFGFTSSLSKNVTGSRATVSSVENAKRYSDLVAELKNTNPKLIGVLIDDGTGDFSDAAYRWQQENALAPGSKTKFRESIDAAEADILNQQQLGWIKFNKAMTFLDAQLAARGLDSYNVKAAADLKQLKDLAVTTIGAENTAWADDYTDTDGSKTRKVVRGLMAIVNNDKFMQDNGDNPTWKSVLAYLSARQMMQGMLAKRQSKSISANSNSDLQYLWDATVFTLKSEDIGFSNLYDRFLSQDPVWDKFEVASR